MPQPGPALSVTKQPYPAVCIHDLFVAQAQQTPHAVALIDGNTHYTYEELDVMTNQLARYLQTQGVGPETFVGCYLSRSSAIVIYMLAILKAGGAYLLLDTLLPKQRLQYLIENAEPTLILADTPLPKTAAQAARRIVFLEDAEEEAVLLEQSLVSSAVQPTNAAYLAYTSGSTGRPKGVIITHQSTVNHAVAFARLFDLKVRERIPIMSPLTFDMATEEIIPPLLSGCTLVVSDSEHTDMAAFTEEITANGYAILNIPAPLWHHWTEYLRDNELGIPPNLRLVIVGSDKIHTKHFFDWQKLPGADLVAWVAAYGTTETTVTSSFYTTAAQDHLQHEPLVPIGKPIANTSFYILDEAGQPVAPGQVGELYIGGHGVARGYHKLPDITQEKFVPDQFADEPEARMYKTGDLARAWEDGTVVCLGRKDLQVKLNGLRIELGEIESVLAEHPHVNQVIAVLHQLDPRESAKRLVAYVTLKTEHKYLPDDLHTFAADRLHRHMVPHEIIHMPKLPLNSNGKFDRKALEGYTTG